MRQHPEGWTVGMEVCMVVTLNVRGTPRPQTCKITKVGRRWITLDDSRNNPSRFDAETRRLDGGQYSSPGMVYPTETEYLESSERHKAWNEFRKDLPYAPPSHLSSRDIRRLILEVYPHLNPWEES